MKKSLLILLFLAFSGKSFSQDFKIPKINWEGKTETENNYAELLKLKNNNSLIIKIGYSSYWTKGENSEFIVYLSDGKVKRFIVYQPNSTEFKTKVKSKKIRTKHYEHYWKYLQKCITENKLKIDKSKLNITEKKGKEKGTFESMSISDGVYYDFLICKGKNYINYGSYEPKTYIEYEYPGSEERQKLIDLMNGFEELTEKY